MSPDAMTKRLHLRRIRVIAVLVDLVERFTVEVEDTRRVVRYPHCGFKTSTVHDRREVKVADVGLPQQRTLLVWRRRRFGCETCGERFLEDQPEIILGRRTHVTRRLAPQLVVDARHLSIREISRRTGLPWHYVMGVVGGWSRLVVAARRRRRCRILLIDETSLRRGHRYVTVVMNGETGEGLGVVKHRNEAALSGFLVAQGHRWLRGVKVVVTDGSKSYRAAIRQHLGGATHVADRYDVAQWLAAGLIEVRRRIQRQGPPDTRPAFDPDIFRSRYLQLSRFDRLDVARVEALGRILAREPNWKRRGGCCSTSTASTSPPTTEKPTRRSAPSSPPTKTSRYPNTNRSSTPCWHGATRSLPSTTPTRPPTAPSRAPTTSSASSVNRPSTPVAAGGPSVGFVGW